MITYEQAVALKKGNTVYAILDNKIVEGKVSRVSLEYHKNSRRFGNQLVTVFWKVKRGTTTRDMTIMQGFPAEGLYLTAKDVVAAAKERWNAQIAEYQRVISLINDKIANAEQFEKERSFKEALLKQVRGEY